MTLSRYNANAISLNGEVIVSPSRRKVAIIAADPSYQEAPFNDDTWEVWGCNSLWALCKDKYGNFRADRWFEMHPMSVQTKEEEAAIRYCPIPIYMVERTMPEGSNCVPYPFKAVQQAFPYRYFTCTFAYQIALALWQGFTTIGLFGVELDQGTSRERTVEKACVEFWLGVAIGMGIEVGVPESSKLMWQDRLYGYDYHAEVEEVSTIVDGIFFRRIQELEAKGCVQRMDIGVMSELEGNA